MTEEFSRTSFSTVSPYYYFPSNYSLSFSLKAFYFYSLYLSSCWIFSFMILSYSYLILLIYSLLCNSLASLSSFYFSLWIRMRSRFSSSLIFSCALLSYSYFYLCSSCYLNFSYSILFKFPKAKSKLFLTYSRSLFLSTSLGFSTMSLELRFCILDLLEGCDSLPMLGFLNILGSFSSSSSLCSSSLSPR